MPTPSITVVAVPPPTSVASRAALAFTVDRPIHRHYARRCQTAVKMERRLPPFHAQENLADTAVYKIGLYADGPHRITLH